MTPEMQPLKRCARCGEVQRLHDEGRCATGEAYHPVTFNWAQCCAEENVAAERIYDRCPNIDRFTGLPVPFEDAMPQTRDRCFKQASVEKWTGAAQQDGE